MKIGIITFHWATNYGAVLQTYALQEYLMMLGHEVSIINYKPKHYNLSFGKIFSNPKYWKRLSTVYKQIKKEASLTKFRDKYLYLTEPYFSESELKNIMINYDVVISGSDQVLNPSYTLFGEGKPTSAYFLNFEILRTRKIGYAVSFGCHIYPIDAMNYLSQWINNFDCLSVREASGLNILAKTYTKSLACVVPDPTILYGTRLFDRISITDGPNQDSPYYFAYLLHGKQVRLEHFPFKVISEESFTNKSIEMWLSYIKDSSGVITNSYHGTIMSILMHKPFVVMLESGGNSGMNDRFFTLLTELGLMDHIVENDDECILVLERPVDWSIVDKRIKDFSLKGEKFLECAL